MRGRIAGRLPIFLVILFGTLSAAWATPQPVTVGAYVNDVHAVQLDRHAYALDFYLWFRWRDPGFDPVATSEIMNVFDAEGHVVTVTYDAPVPMPDGSLYQIVRHQVLLGGALPVTDYPFDRQELVIALEDTDNDATELVFVPDEDSLTINAELTLPGYRVGAPFLRVYEKPYPTAFGDLSEPDRFAYSRAEFVVPIARPVAPALLKTFMPILLIVMGAAFALILDPAHVEARIGLAITVLLTLVAMELTLGAELPQTSYLTLLDAIFLASYAYVIAVIAVVVVGTRLDDRGMVRGTGVRLPGLLTGGLRAAAAFACAYLIVVAGVIAAALA